MLDLKWPHFTLIFLKLKGLEDFSRNLRKSGEANREKACNLQTIYIYF